MKDFCYRFQLHPLEKLVSMEYAGGISLQKLVPFVTFLWEYPGFEPGFNGILDLRKAHLEMSPKEVKQYMEFENGTEYGAKAEAVLVAENEKSSALSMLYQFYSAAANVTIVNSLQEAYTYFGLDPSDYCRGEHIFFKEDSILFGPEHLKKRVQNQML